MGVFQDLSGRQFGLWKVIARRAENGPRNETMWCCVCACGTTRAVRARALKTGQSASCGCTNAIGERARTHGHSAGAKITPTYHTWAGMKARCSNPKNSHFSSYGGRGIVVCERWQKFENFLADMGEKPAGHSIDRTDPNGNYTPENCRWASTKTQASNKTNSRLFEAFGKKQSLQDWANDLGVSHGTLIFRIDRAGWELERALTTPGRGYGGRKPAKR